MNFSKVVVSLVASALVGSSVALAAPERPTSTAKAPSAPSAPSAPPAPQHKQHNYGKQDHKASMNKSVMTPRGM